jgi:hypothetical protein
MGGNDGAEADVEGDNDGRDSFEGFGEAGRDVDGSTITDNNLWEGVTDVVGDGSVMGDGFVDAIGLEAFATVEDVIERVGMGDDAELEVASWNEGGG